MSVFMCAIFICSSAKYRRFFDVNWCRGPWRHECYIEMSSKWQSIAIHQMEKVIFQCKINMILQSPNQCEMNELLWTVLYAFSTFKGMTTTKYHLVRAVAVSIDSSQKFPSIISIVSNIICVCDIWTVTEWEGEVLEIARISRLDMSAYLCIASNGVPPSVSKRIKVSVDCEYACWWLIWHNSKYI